MDKLQWFERTFTFGLPKGMLPFYIERMEGTLPRIEMKVRGIAEEVLSNRLNGKWSVKENIGHLAEVNEVSHKRIEELIAGISPLSPAVFEPKGYHEWPIQKVLDFFRVTREKNIDRYRTLNSDQLEKQGLHPRLKLMVSPVDLAWFEAEHDDHHLVRINEILETLVSRKAR
jgi:hypothetical protein